MGMRWLMLTAAMSLSGCLCAGPPVGECNGTWGGETFDHVQLDLDSKVIVVAKPVCGSLDLNQYRIGWGGSKVRFDLDTTRAPSILLGELVWPVPIPVENVASQNLIPTGAIDGEVRLGKNGLEAKTGKITLKNGTDTLVCSFDVHTEPKGIQPKCSSSGGHDFD